MWFKPKQGFGASHPPVIIEGHQLQEVEEQKYLRIMFDRKLQWGPQINYISDGCEMKILLELARRHNATLAKFSLQCVR